MGKIILTAVISCVVTSIAWYAAMRLCDAFLATTLRSAVKAPGRMALEEIQRDLDAGNYDMAKGHVSVLRESWSRFEAEPGPTVEQGIGNIMVEFRDMEEKRSGPSASKTRNGP